ncbi:MAG: AI-2E family transporter [Lactobacillales bacterium]|jgi:predicted PurR-regulated permease PerM|nr:AI-2E family transporter [Lactobacillales bacterium]
MGIRKQKNKPKDASWFWKWFLDSKSVTVLSVILLFLLVVLVFTKVSYLFEPVWQFLAIVGLPIILAAVFYYMLNPIVDFLEKKSVPRIASIIGLFIVLVALLVWGIVVLIPNIESQTSSFLNNVPNYLRTIDKKSREILSNSMFASFRPQLEEIGQNVNSQILEWVRSISTNAVHGLGNFLGALTTIVIAVITMPFILFYLLKDGKKLLPHILNLLPVKLRKTTKSVLVEVNDQLSSYIRGQLTVAMAVAIMFIIGFNIIGLEYAVTIGIAAGFLNLIPYLGSFLAMVPAVLLGLVAGPVMLVKVLVVFFIEQTLEGRLISPLVLGSQLDIHPITILLVLLTSGKLFGLVGVILGIPVYAAVKVIVVHFYEWYRDVSGLYDEDEEKEIPSE